MDGYISIASTFFETFLRRNISFSVVALLIILGRLFLKKFPKKYSYALWACLGARALFDLSLNIPKFNLTNNKALKTLDTVNTLVTVEDKYIFNTLDNPGNTVATFALNAKGLALSIFFFVWIVGAAFMICHGILGYLSIKKKTKVSFKEGNLYKCDYITSPMAFGFFRPKVYVPTGCDVNSMSFVIEHEKTHIKRGDVYFKLIAFLILSAFWMNPLSWLCFKLFNLDMELSCDEAVLFKAGIDKKDEYSKWLLFYSTKERNLSLAPTAFGETDTKRRVKNIMKLKEKGIIVTFAGLMLTTAIIAVCFIILPESANAKGDVSGDNAFNVTSLDVSENIDTSLNTETIEPETKMETSNEEEKTVITWVRPFSDSAAYLITNGYVTEPNESGLIHKAIDLAAPLGTEVYAIADGTVSEAGYDYEAGNYIIVKVNEDISYKYRQLDEYLVKEGDSVKGGDVVAKVGSTGRSTGPCTPGHRHRTLCHA
ncbi:MAG: peptidoglycan DD-metalloendopeptidase family protein, partial [Lachnospiraceae bacterium]|nr:peptidoglycan DD-metalloendopeptidase family protein [Lachnospiraceae bacterium]